MNQRKMLNMLIRPCLLTNKLAQSMLFQLIDSSGSCRGTLGFTNFTPGEAVYTAIVYNLNIRILKQKQILYTQNRYSGCLYCLIK